MIKGLLEIMHNYTKEYKDIEAAPNDLFVPFGNLYNIATDISNRFEQQVTLKIAGVEAKCKEEITWVDNCLEDIAKGTEYAEADKPYLEGMRNMAVKIMKIIDSNFS